MTVHDQLRAWAAGTHTTEAGTELLISGFDGRFAEPGNPWIHPTDRGGYWVDFAGLGEHTGALSGGEQRLLRIAASIGSSNVQVNFGNDVAGLDRPALRLVLAAVAHAAGSDQHTDSIVDHSAGTFVLVNESSLYPWDDHAASGRG